MAATLQIHAPAAADVDEAGEIALHRPCSYRGCLPAAEKGDGTEQESERQRGARLAQR
jgi:hypothetical protein